MQLLGFLGVAALSLASLAVGTRLVWLAWRSRRLPELGIGLSYLFAGFLSAVFTLATGELRRAGSEDVRTATVAASVTLHIGVMFLVLFVWAVFRRGSRAGTAGAALAAAFVAATFVGVYLEDPELAGRGGWGWASLLGRIGVYTWAAGESLREYAAARKRARLGLADPLVANRLLLWGVGTGCVLLLWLHTAWRLAGPVDDPTADYPWIAVLGCTCAATSWLAFFPPAFYRRWFVPTA